MTPLEEKLKLQCQVLADRLGLAYSFLMDVEIDVDYERHADEPNRFSRARHMVLSNCDAFETMRAKRRKSVLYETAMTEIKAWLTDELRKERVKEKAAA